MNNKFTIVYPFKNPIKTAYDLEREKKGERGWGEEGKEGRSVLGELRRPENGVVGS